MNKTMKILRNGRLRALAMFKLNQFNIALFSLSMGCFGIAYANSNLVALTDEQLAATTGQALMSLGYLAPTDSANPMKNITGSNNIGFYKLGLEAELELNANIKNLQLGCGGVNNSVKSDSCDIDIKNLSLSGLPDSYDGNGNPVYNNGRASTSATLTNPFIEFAISNPDKSSTREVKGIRFSAEKINALLTAGLANGTSASTTDGIQTLSGFMQIAQTSGTASTKPITFGNASGQAINGYADVSGLTDVHFDSDPSKSSGITIPSVSTGFTVNAFTINGVRKTQAEVRNIRTTISSIPIAAAVGDTTDTTFANDKLYVNLNCTGNTGILCGAATFLVPNTSFVMDKGSDISNLSLSIDFFQSLSMIHNIPLTGNGGYLSLQSTALLWPGATIASGDTGVRDLSNMSANTDVARPGWWMSFSNPVQLGQLNVQQQVDISAVLPQVATLVSNYLSATDASGNNTNAPYVNFGQVIGALVGSPIYSKLNVDLGSYTATNPAKLVLTDQQLKNQGVVANCYGGLKFC